MGILNRSVLPVALRAWIARGPQKAKKPYHPPAMGWPEQVLVLDMESTTDASQRLTFGSWRLGNFGEHGVFECLEEGLIYADDLPESDPEGWTILLQYSKTHKPATTNRRRAELLLRSRRQFVAEQLWTALDGGALVVGYNLAFDLTRLGVECGEARHYKFRGGFSIMLFEQTGGREGEHAYRPRIRIKSLDSKRTFMGVAHRKGARPEERRQPLEALGRLLDLKHLVFALTDRNLSLASAAPLFGLEIGKLETDEHGVISVDYIDYNRRDVEVTAHLLEATRAEWDRHPLVLSPDKVMSPASLGKGYLRAMNVIPPGRKFDLGNSIFGACMTAYFGGRSEVRIRRTVVPVVYLDFLSMYPTVNSLLGLWRMLTAERLKVHTATMDVRELFGTITLEQCFDQAMWEQLRFFAKIRPHGDILPVRAAYGASPDNYTIGVNPVWSDVPVWVAGPDLVASFLLTGHEPEVLEAFRLTPIGQQANLGPVELRGQVRIDPKKEDFFRRIVEERRQAKRRPDLTEEERQRLERFLKVLANSASYGIFAELNPQPTETGGPEAAEVYGLEEMFPTSTRSPEEPGEFCFPPFAALTTSGARLMLAMLERCVRDLGGEIAFGDTDSAAVVATEAGGLVPCMGGPELKDGEGAVRALTWEQVRDLVDRFKTLSPYDREVIPDSILKIEDVNVEKGTTVQRQLFTFAISAKRYALFVRTGKGDVEVVDPKEHGLGHLIDPMDLGQEERTWISEVWAALIREALDQSLALPAWVDRPAMSRITVSTTGIWHTYDEFNNGRAYPESVKPMNFGLSPILARFGYPHPERFHLLGTYEKNPAKWLTMPWFDKYSGKSFQIGVGRQTPGDLVQVKSYRDVIEEYRVHPEPKSLDASGNPCDRASRGLLSRRPVEVESLVCIGKESHAFEQVTLGLVHSRKEVQPTYQPPQLTAWDLIYLPAIRRVPLKQLVTATGLGSREIRHFWKRDRRPSPAAEEILRAVAARWANQVLTGASTGNCAGNSTGDCAGTLPGGSVVEDQQIAERVLAIQAPSRARKAKRPVRRRRRKAR